MLLDLSFHRLFRSGRALCLLELATKKGKTSLINCFSKSFFLHEYVNSSLTSCVRRFEGSV